MTKNTNPSDALTKRANPIRVAIIALAAVVVVAGLSVGAAAVGSSIKADSKPTAVATPLNAIGDDAAPVVPLDPAEVDGAPAVDAAQAAATLAAEQAAQAAAEAATAAAEKKAAEQAHVTGGTVHCPAGSVAGAVDAAGNESNCQPENGAGEVCQAYNDQNQCTAWAKP